MTQPRLAHQTPHGRMYARSSGLPEVPSITTVIGMEKTDLDGWVGWMAAQSVTQDPRLAESVGSAARLKQVARQSADAAARYRDAAAERGDRVHDYAEQVAQRALGRPHTMAEARARLIEHGEGAYADRFDEWWDLYDVRPIAAEITVWNHTVGYAGTLDLVARIGGRLCLIDYKTKGTGRDGRVKALDPKVVMQLTAGLKAEESSWIPRPAPGRSGGTGRPRCCSASPWGDRGRRAPGQPGRAAPPLAQVLGPAPGLEARAGRGRRRPRAPCHRPASAVGPGVGGHRSAGRARRGVRRRLPRRPGRGARRVVVAPGVCRGRR